MGRIGPWAVVAVDHAFRGVAEGGMANGDGRAGREAAREDRFSRELSEILEDLNARSGERD